MADYVLVHEARNDLRKIIEYIAEDNLDAASDVLDRFEEVFGLLAENPEMGHCRGDLTERPVRFFPVYSFLAIYLPDTSPLQIVRVLSTARDVERLLD